MKTPFGETSDRIQKQLESLELQSVSSKAIRSRQIVEAMEALRSALQEVEAVEEELTQQNEELIAARESLEIERHRYKDLFDRAPDGFLITDEHGVIEEANVAAFELLSAGPRALYGKPFAVFIDLKDRQVFRSRISALRAGQKLQDLEVLLASRESGPRPALVTVVRDHEKPGGPSRLFWILRDISARKSAEEALRESEERLRHSQRLEAVGRLAGGIAHSFNNLLAAIAFHADLALDDLPAGSRARHHAEEILQAGERGATLARQLLAFGRKQVLQPRVLAVNEVLAQMEPMMRRLIGEHIRLRVDLCQEDSAVCADLGQIEQVILNLVVNARDAMPRGGQLVLSTAARQLSEQEAWGEESLAPGSYVALSIADTGAGMPAEVLSHLFEPFFTTKDRDRGTGLGLSTVYGIVHQSGGGIRVESEPGRGSVFTILLPHAEDASQTCAPAELRQPSPRGRLHDQGAETVLVVEDEDNIREPMIEVLESRGYTVLAARDANEALETAQSHAGPIRLLVTDVIMPGMNGVQLAEHLESSLPNLRVLYISGYPEDSIAQQGVLSPGRTFLQKPFPPGVLLSTVREVLDRPI